MNIFLIFEVACIIILAVIGLCGTILARNYIPSMLATTFIELITLVTSIAFIIYNYHNLSFSSIILSCSLKNPFKDTHLLPQVRFLFYNIYYILAYYKK